jgi:serine/threonine protein kinase
VLVLNPLYWQEIIKEISIMQQCDSPYVVKYYGSYFHGTDLWVCVLLLQMDGCLVLL